MPVDYSRDHVNARISTLKLAALMQRTLIMTCRACPHVKIWDCVPLWWKFYRRNWDDRLSVIPRRFYCSECWHVRTRKIGRPKIVLSDDAPTGKQPAYPDLREWKRIQARYRC